MCGNDAQKSGSRGANQVVAYAIWTRTVRLARSVPPNRPLVAAERSWKTSRTAGR